MPTEPWGVEVRLPLGFDHGRADPALRQSTAQWRAEGVLRIDDAPLPEMTDASILLPAGARGPAFLVGSNFRAILRYNNATSYALAAGLLAQQLAGGPGVQMPWPRDLVALTLSQVLALQTALNEAGFASGPPDGLAGPATRNALRQFQRSLGLPADGFPTLDLRSRLQARRAAQRRPALPRARLAVISAAESVTSHEKYTHSRKIGKAAKAPYTAL